MLYTHTQKYCGSVLPLITILHGVRRTGAVEGIRLSVRAQDTGREGVVVELWAQVGGRGHTLVVMANTDHTLSDITGGT